MGDAAAFLFGLLDDIDTLDDACRADDRAFREAVRRVQRRRFEVAGTDGYSVTFKCASHGVAAVETSQKEAPITLMQDGAWLVDQNGEKVALAGERGVCVLSPSSTLPELRALVAWLEQQEASHDR